MVKATPKSDTIDIEAKYFLNAEGVDYCVRNRIPVRDLHGRDMSRSSGFEWRKCGVDTLSRLVSGGYLSAIEATRPEFASAREPLVRLADIVLSGFLVSRFRSDLKGRVFLEPSISALRMAMREDERLRRETSARFERGDWIDPLRSAIRSACAAEAVLRPPIEERVELEARCLQLIRAIDKDTLLALALAGASPLAAVAGIVLAYAGRMGVAGYLSPMLVEFVQLAEKSYLHNLAERDRYVRTHPQELQRLLASPSFREKLMEIAASRGESMLLRIEFSSPRQGSGGGNRLDISTRTRGLIGYGSRYDFVNSKSKEVRTMDLAALLTIAAGNDGGAKLGLVYHTNLAAACAKEAVIFSSSVILDERKDETVVTMSVTV